MTGNIDDLAALIREAENGRERFLEKFAAFCEQAFPRQATVTRKTRGWLKRTVDIDELALRFETRVFLLRRERDGVVAEIAHEVRGVVISRKQVPVRDWITELRQKIHETGLAISGEGRASAELTDFRP
ncbi:hypothetical protein [Gluconobacter sp. OJB]|uniref:hypothetical protein n=1 Tax=Gluconobacter sp. OJB TaxID=3145196 RepID=UPI0031F86788